MFDLMCLQVYAVHNRVAAVRVCRAVNHHSQLRGARVRGASAARRQDHPGTEAGQ